MNSPSHIFIVALRRSGTTAFWSLFRNCPSHICFDEPFNDLLENLPHENRKGTNNELIEIYRQDPERFRKVFAKIEYADELEPQMSDAQRRYLEFLLSKGPAIIDFTRVLQKLPEFQSVAPGALLVHLYRRPAAWVSSILVPSSSPGKRKLAVLRKKYNEIMFFKRKAIQRERGRWGYSGSYTFRRVYDDFLRSYNVNVPNGEASMAERLMALWLAAFRYTESEGKRLYGDRFISLRFEDFIVNPHPVLDHMAELAGFDQALLPLTSLRPPNPGFRPLDKQWEKLYEQVGFTQAELRRVAK